MRAAVAFIAAAAAMTNAASLKEKPIVGILSQPLSEDDDRPYIASSYVKWVESSGARVIPIQYNVDKKNLTDTFNTINGILFPGGAADLTASSKFFQSATHLYNMVVAANRAGDHFPLWATCLGFEALAILASGHESALQGGFHSWNYPIPLNVTEAARSSRLLGSTSLPEDIYEAMLTQKITMNNHHMGIEPGHWSTYPGLVDNFTILSTNMDSLDGNGRPFVSTVEHKTMPIYGVQWHPEKNPFEWTDTEDIPHSADAVSLAWHLGTRFLEDVRLNGHSMPKKQQEGTLIYNFAPTYTGIQGSGFEQKYIWGTEHRTTAVNGDKGLSPGTGVAIGIGAFVGGVVIAMGVVYWQRLHRPGRGEMDGFVMTNEP